MELNPPEVFLFVLPYSELFTLTHCSWNKQGGLLFLLKTTVGVVSDDCATVPCEQTFHFTTEWCNERRFSLKQWMKCWKRGGLFCLPSVIIWGLFHQWNFTGAVFSGHLSLGRHASHDLFVKTDCILSHFALINILFHLSPLWKVFLWCFSG